MALQVYPFVTQIRNASALARGPFAPGFPQGVTVHYSADRDLERVLQSDAQDGYCYHILIDRDGSVIQSCYFDQKTWHAGNARWKGLSPNSSHVAICLLSWGRLTPGPNGDFLSWSGATVPAAEVASRPDNLTGQVAPWDIATPAQEAALEKACLWLMANGIQSSQIAGHDEVAIPKGRKDDPGGVLSRTMPDFRLYLQSVYAGRNTAGQ